MMNVNDGKKNYPSERRHSIDRILFFIVFTIKQFDFSYFSLNCLAQKNFNNMKVSKENLFICYLCYFLKGIWNISQGVQIFSRKLFVKMSLIEYNYGEGVANNLFSIFSRSFAVNWNRLYCKNLL
jgi:hypothetical protein